MASIAAIGRPSITGVLAVQIKAAGVLVDLLSQDLPPASWLLYQNEPVGRLRGLVSDRAEIAQWAEFLGVDMTETPGSIRCARDLHADGTHHGVEVQMTATVYVHRSRWWRWRRS